MADDLESGNKGMHGAKASSNQARSNSAKHCSAKELAEGASICKDGFRYSGHPSQARDNSDWEMLSVEDELTSLERMPQRPTVDNIMRILQKCRRNKNLACAKRLHAYVCKRGLEAHRSLGNYLVPMFVECGSMWHAEQVFNKMGDPNEYSWTSLIAGYVEYGESHHALKLYQQMQEHDAQPSRYTFVSLLKACARVKDAERGLQIHTEIARQGLETDPFLGNTLVDMYAKCGLFSKAQEVFDWLPIRDVISWNVLITGHSEQGFDGEALNCFKRMQLEGVSPDAVTFVCSLKACRSIRAIEKGKEIHAEIIKKKLDRNPFVGSTLVDMYAKCGLLAEAREAFDKLSCRNVVTWTALIAGYAEHGLGEEALNCFEQMQLEGLSPDAVTFVCSLKACGSLRAKDKGREIHAEIARKGLERDLFVGNTLVDMYSKCDLLAEARDVFDRLPIRDVVSWNALMAGYIERGVGEEALDCFLQMELGGVSPNAVSFFCSLKACACVGAIDKGQEIHAQIARKGLESDPFIGNTLVDMYAKCTLVAKSQEVFDRLPIRDVVSWNALITGHAQLGESEIVFHMFERMREEGIDPNGVTFLSILTVCCHGGLIDKGQQYFEAMSRDYGITATIEHHTCMVDLLSRAGQLDKAVAMVKKMPVQPNLAVWHTVLAACHKWGNVELGRQAFEHVVRLDQRHSAAYVLMSNIYADANMHEDEKKIETMILKEQAWPKPIQIWTDIG